MTERDFNILIFIPFLKGEQFCINIVILICFLICILVFYRNFKLIWNLYFNELNLPAKLLTSKRYRIC